MNSFFYVALAAVCFHGVGFSGINAATHDGPGATDNPEVCPTRPIIVVGSGRCGTKAFASFLNRQSTGFVFHEGKFDVLSNATSTESLAIEQVRLCTDMPWDVIADSAVARMMQRNVSSLVFSANQPQLVDTDDLSIIMRQRAMGRIQTLQQAVNYVVSSAAQRKFQLVSPTQTPLAVFGDVGFHYVPYVDVLLKSNPCVNVVVLRRNRTDTIASFDRWFGPPFRHFPWASSIDRSRWIAESARLPDAQQYMHHPDYDACYANFEWGDRTPTIADGAARWYDHVYNITAALQRLWPARVHTVDSYAVLNDPEVAASTLEFIFANTEDTGTRSWVLPSLNDLRLFHATDEDQARAIASSFRQ